MAAVAESHDLTRWQGNYYKHYSQCSSHSESITRAFFCFFFPRRGGEVKGKQEDAENADAGTVPSASGS